MSNYHTMPVFKKSALILLGTLIYSAGISLFLDPNSIAPGGVAGIAVILSHVTRVTTGTWYFLLNVPIILLGWQKFGRKFIIYCFYAVALNSIFTNLLRLLPPVTDNRLLASIAGGVLMGTGISLVLRTGATTGGIDILIKVVRLRYKNLKTSTLFMWFDAAIVAVSGIVFRNFDIMMYAFLTVVVNERVMDSLLYGRDEAKMIYIISKNTERVVNRILSEMDIGATLLTGRGAYSNEEKAVILCVVKKQLAPKLEDIIKEEDDTAFMIVSSASEIYGEGYKNILAQGL